MNETEKTRAFIQNYFDSISAGRLEDIPIADCCSYTGSMLAETIQGADAVREHIAQIAPFIDRIEVKRMVVEGTNGAVIAHLLGFGNRQVKGVVFFVVENGCLMALDNLFDSRQLLGAL
jgi:hypothetical protein